MASRRYQSLLVAAMVFLSAAATHAAVVTQYEFENNLSDTGAGGAFADNLGVTNGGAAVYALGVNGSSVRIGGILASDPLNLSAASTADLNLGSTWTLETYMKPTDVAGFQRTMLKWGTSYHFGVRNGGLDLFINGAPNPIAAQGSVPLNQWSHLVVSNDASNAVNGLKGYVNGALVYSGAGVNVTNGADPLNVGNQNGAGFAAVHQFNGYLDGMRIHNTAVDQAYVNARFAEVPISVAPTSVNRIIGGSFTNTHFSDLFSVNTSSTQHTLLQLSTATLQSALAARLGPLGPNQSYEIDSATLLVGSPTDGFNIAAKAHEVLTAYNSGTVTYANFNNGGVAGVNFDAVAEATGLVNGPVTTFDLTDLVQQWIDGGPNLGVYFPMMAGIDMETNASNVLFEIHAHVVTTPEPSSVALWGCVGLCGLAVVAMRRHNLCSQRRR